MSKPLSDKQLRDLTEKTRRAEDSWLIRLIHALMIGVAVLMGIWHLLIYLERHTALLGTPNP